MLTFISDYENYFPTSIKTLYAINSPRILESLVQLILSLVSQRTKESIQIYGLNKNEWMGALRKAIHPSQLKLAFGGKRKGKNSFVSTK
jgi:hypothetical protein